MTQLFSQVITLPKLANKRVIPDTIKLERLQLKTPKLQERRMRSQIENGGLSTRREVLIITPHP